MLPIQFKSRTEIGVLLADLKTNQAKEALSDCLYLMFNTSLCREIYLGVEAIESFLKGDGNHVLYAGSDPILDIRLTKKEIWFCVKT